MRRPALRSRAQGCAANGSPSFIGIASTKTPDYAGSGAGVAAGYSNSSCDFTDFIGAGILNVVGGEGLSSYASIGAGQNNTIDIAPNGFVGGGQSNAVYGYATGSDSSDSAIVAGRSNTVNVPESAIAAGSNNSIYIEDAMFDYGGTNDFIGSGAQNYIAAAQSALVAGYQNGIGSDYSFVGAGEFNRVQEGYADGDVAGAYNTVAGGLSFVGSGESNRVVARAAAIGAGYHNHSLAYGAFIGAGASNTNSGIDAAIGGGKSNVDSGAQGFVGAGQGNIASGTDAVISGGIANVATGYASFAGGVRASARNDGTFVWSDDGGSGSVNLASKGPNEFLVRSSGGVFFYSDPQLTCGVELKPGTATWTPIGSKCAVASDEADLRAENRALVARVAKLETEMAAVLARR
jgi:hypothetical protein